MLPEEQKVINADLQARFRDLVAVQKRPFCYYVLATPNDDGQCQVGLVVQGEPGMFLLDFTWGTSQIIAQSCADKKNRELGLSDRDVANIVTSSMVVSKTEIKRNK